MANKKTTGSYAVQVEYRGQRDDEERTSYRYWYTEQGGFRYFKKAEDWALEFVSRPGNYKLNNYMRIIWIKDEN